MASAYEEIMREIDERYRNSRGATGSWDAPEGYKAVLAQIAEKMKGVQEFATSSLAQARGKNAIANPVESMLVDVPSAVGRVAERQAYDQPHFGRSNAQGGDWGERLEATTDVLGLGAPVAGTAKRTVQSAVQTGAKLGKQMAQNAGGMNIPGSPYAQAGKVGTGTPKFMQPSRIDDMPWRPLADVKSEVGLTEVPPYITENYGKFMQEQAGRAARGDLNQRDLVKAYGITRSSVNRGARNMSDDIAKGDTRPEGYMAEWLLTPQGKAYLDAAVRGGVDENAIQDIVKRFRSFGMADTLGKDLRYAANLPKGDVNAAVTGPLADYRAFAQQLHGIGPSKSGFIASLLGRGDLPTWDARQIKLHTGKPATESSKFLTRGGGKGGDEVVDKLARRQEEMGIALPEEFAPHRQHLTHHAVWDKVAGTKTTHDDLVRAMRLASITGGVGVGAGLFGANEAEAGPIDSAIKQALKFGPVKQGLIDQGYYHPIGGGKKLRTLVPDMTFERTPNVAKVERKIISPEQLQGGVLVPAVGDRTAAGELLTSVGGRKLANPVQLQGGPDFMRTHAPHGAAWASDKGVITSLSRITREAAEGGRPVYMPNVAMGHTSGDFSTMMADTLLEQARVGNIKAADIKTFDESVRAIRKEWAGLKSPKAREQLDKSGELRKVVIDRMGLDESINAGFPDIPTARRAIMDTSLLEDPLHGAGRTIAKLDPTGRAISNPSAPHASYNTQLAGEYIGGLEQAVPREIMFPSFTAARRRAGKDTAGDARSFQLSNPTQLADQEWLDNIMRWAESLRGGR